ncbi:folate-binding protein YgfZ [Apodospora peruviana]|uniref:Iron-sulfur cluster assembly factor IBA57 homolog, mitochondrial n=1 Tax=Apodospora peruviana TaxID=516989 RepID=A0AAE0M7W0_9PEZI|nr:folate-binding protein YgfZ [Apodospora peruviana]
MHSAVSTLARPAAHAARLQPSIGIAAGFFICQSCLSLSRRRAAPSSYRKSLFSTQTQALPDAPASSGLAALPSRRLISVSGPDAAKYLQGVITANITDPSSGGPRTSGFYAAFLTAKGRVLHDVFIYPDHAEGGKPPTGDSFLIEVDAAEAQRLQQHIKRYKLRANFDVRLLDTEERQVWHAWSDGASDLCSSMTSTNADEFIFQPDPRAPGLGYRLITSCSTSSSSPIQQISDNLPVLSEEYYRIRRYLHGVPEGQQEILRDQALPLESNIDFMGDGIDFRKGCYVGQELTIRTKHRGVVRKRILPVMLYNNSSEKPTEMVYRPSISSELLPAPESRIGRHEKTGRVGHWLRGIGSIGLALCRLEAMTDIQPASTFPGAKWVLAEDEFIIAGQQEEQQFKIKAFVPDWLRSELLKPPAH